jgi:hypothetical protein
MTTPLVIDSDSGAQGADVACWACEALERDTTLDAATLHGIAQRCVCGGVTPDVLAELAGHAATDEAARELLQSTPGAPPTANDGYP